MLLFLLICQWRVCKIVCNFQHYFGGRSKRESSCLEIRSSAQFLREIWISYFARRILERVFVGGIVNIRNECLFFSVHGKWIAVRNKQIAWTAIFFFSVHGKWIAVRNKQIAREPLRCSRDLFVPHCDSFPMNREKKRFSCDLFVPHCDSFPMNREKKTLIP